MSGRAAAGAPCCRAAQVGDLDRVLLGRDLTRGARLLRIALATLGARCARPRLAANRRR